MGRGDIANFTIILIRPFKLLLSNEIITSLNECVRQDLLCWIIKELKKRGANILYATNIFVGTDEMATHLH